MEKVPTNPNSEFGFKITSQNQKVVYLKVVVTRHRLFNTLDLGKETMNVCVRK